ncbi:hypothetical protein ACYF6T_09890 [Streptomyces sp. 7R007]
MPQGPGGPQGFGAAPQAYAPAAPVPAPAPALSCRICGAFPAREITIRRHTGLLVALRWGKVEGPLCRSCGVAVHREMTTHTLAAGWWSPVSLLAAPLTLLWNLFVHFRLARFPQPSPSPTGVVLDPGKPVFHRPLAYVPLLLPVLWLALYVWNQSNY